MTPYFFALFQPMVCVLTVVFCLYGGNVHCDGSVDALRTFLQYYKEDSKRMSIGLNPEKLAAHANEWMLKAADHLSVDEKKLRKISAARIKELKDSFSLRPIHIVMRAGELDLPSKVKALRPVARKIISMRRYNNMKNPMSALSTVEFIGTLIVIDALVIDRLLAEFSTLKIVTSSLNRRAADAAKMLVALCGADVENSEAFTCVNLPGKKIMKFKDLQKKLPDGRLPWQEEMVDALALLPGKKVPEKGTYQSIVKDMGLYRTSVVGNLLSYGLTHEQQLHAFGGRGAFESFGFIAFSDDGKPVQSFPNGFHDPRQEDAAQDVASKN